MSSDDETRGRINATLIALILWEIGRPDIDTDLSPTRESYQSKNISDFDMTTFDDLAMKAYAYILDHFKEDLSAAIESARNLCVVLETRFHILDRL